MSALAAKLRARMQAQPAPTPETASTSADAHELVQSFQAIETEATPAPVVSPPATPAPAAASPAVVGVLDLGRPLRGCPVAVIDVETTGIDTAEARIVEIAVVLVDALGESEPVVALHTRVNPGILIPGEVTAVHGISDADVADAPSFAEVFPQVVAATAGRVMAAYNAAYDCRVLAAETERHVAATDPGPNPAPHLLWGRWLDPFILARLVDKFAKGKRLGDVAARRGMDVDAHGAAGDAMTTALLLPMLLGEAARLVDRGGRPTQGRPTGADLATVGSFLAWQRTTALAQEVDFAKFKRGEQVDSPWHELEGVQPPGPVAREVGHLPCPKCSRPIVWAVRRDGQRVAMEPGGEPRQAHACAAAASEPAPAPARQETAVDRGARLRERRLDLLPTHDRDVVVHRLLRGLPVVRLLDIEQGTKPPPGGWDVIEARMLELLEEHVAQRMATGLTWEEVAAGLRAWSAEDVRAAAQAVEEALTALEVTRG